MKKTLNVLAICLVLAISAPMVNAQVFDEGDIVMSAGVGVGSVYDNHWNSYYTTTLPILWLTGDYCLREDLGPGNLGIGALMAFNAYKYEFLDEKETYTTFLIGARGTYHFVDLVDNLDLYGGVSLGLRAGNTYYNSASVYAFEELFAGARYYFSDNFGVNGEVGYGVAVLKLGISLKF